MIRVRTLGDRIDHHLGVAVIGGDDPAAALRRQRCQMRPRQASTASTARTVGSILPEWPTMSALAKFITITSKSRLLDGVDHDARDAFRAHLAASDRRSRPSATRPSRAPRRRKGFSLPPLKKYVTCAYFSVSATRRFFQFSSAMTLARMLFERLLRQHERNGEASCRTASSS